MALKRTSHTLWRAAALVALTALAAGSSLAQWQWIDSTGSRVFSDTPPPAGTPDKNILKRPGAARTVSIAPVAPGSSTSGSSTAAAPPEGKDGELEARKKRAEEADQAKRKAEMEKLAKARAENCERAKGAKATLDSGIRIAITNAKGEREVMDDKARAKEAQRLNEVISNDCGPLPSAAVQ